VRCARTNPPRLAPRKIKLLLFDVDGVLTDGKLYIFPAPARIQQSTQEHAAKLGGRGGFVLVSQTLIEAKGFQPTMARPFHSLGWPESRLG
jgi:hypothetical protein